MTKAKVKEAALTGMVMGVTVVLTVWFIGTVFA